MAQIRLHLIAALTWFAFLFNIERVDLLDGKPINLDTSVYIVVILLTVGLLSFPDLGRLNLWVSSTGVVGIYLLIRSLIGIPWTEVLPYMLVINLASLIITLLVVRRLGQSLMDFERAVESFILDVHGSRMVPRTEGEETVNHELYRARRFERPVAIVYAQVVENPHDEKITSIVTDFMSWQITDAFRRRYEQVRLAHTVASLTYKSDAIVEYNGAVVACLPETTEQEAEAFARQLESFAGEISKLGVKIGISCFPDDGLMFEDLANAAKRNIRFWPPSSGTDERNGDVYVPTDQRIKLEQEAAWVNKLPYQSSGARSIYRFVKRRIEVDLMQAMLVFALPLMGLIALAIYLDDSGPIFYTQWRTGYGGRRFKIYKFRTMYANAPSTPAQVVIGPNGKKQYLWPEKVEDDPRITRVGRFLRKTSLDELPQIFNVLRGDMSIVGPRPTSWDLDKYTLHQTARLMVRPGITGLWQVCAREATNFDERLLWDLKYIEKMSPWLDAKILWRTLAQVFNKGGV